MVDRPDPSAEFETLTSKTNHDVKKIMMTSKTNHVFLEDSFCSGNVTVPNILILNFTAFQMQWVTSQTKYKNG